MTRDAAPADYFTHAARHNEALALDRLELLSGVVETVDAMPRAADGVDPALIAEAHGWRARADSAFRPVGTFDHQGARELGWDVLLPGWARSHLAADTASARELLDSAASLGARLDDDGGDGSLRAATDSIRRQAVSPAMLDRLAAAHLALDSARRLLRKQDPAGAIAQLDRFRRERLPSSALRQSSRLLHALASAGSDPKRTERELVLLRGESGGRATAFLRGRVMAALGTFALRAARHAEGTALLEEAGVLFTSIGETEAIGNVESVLAEALFEVGRRDEGFAVAHRALITLRDRPNSVWRHNVLLTLARVSLVDDRPFAALRIADEDVALTTRLPASDSARLMYEVEARLSRGGVLTALGDRDAAREEFARARALFPSLRPNARRFLESNLLLAEAGVARAGDGTVSAAAIDSVVADTVRRRNTPRLQLAHLARAEWRLQTADTLGAIADLDSASRLFQVKQQGTATLVDRAALAGAADATANRMAALALARGDDLGALLALERPRYALFSARSGDDAGGGSGMSIDPGELTIVIAAIGDWLHAWTPHRGAMRLTSWRVPGDELRRTIALANAGLAERASADALRPTLERLHDWLVRPLDARLPVDGMRLRWVPHGMLADVPFAALRDARANRYLVERYALAQGSLAAKERAAPRREAGRVVVVADPAFDRAAYPELSPLADAAAEARAISAAYGGADTVAGRAATRSAVLRGLGESRVFHFAGHALVDDLRAQRSRLVLAGTDGALSAEEIAGLDLSRMRLAVLSACTGVSAQRTTGTALADLAGSFLAAGAEGVVASPWLVDDALARVLMERMHVAYRKSDDGAAALREAQLQMIQSRAEREQAPGAWAAFRYITR